MYDTMPNGFAAIKGTSLVAFYRHLPSSLSHLVEGIQARLCSMLPVGSYEPQPAAQIHATIIRLGTALDVGIHSSRSDDDDSMLPIAEVHETISASSALPFSIQFGGYNKSQDYGFESDSRSPYDRSFDIRGDHVVLIGWPERRDWNGVTPLGSLRAEFEKRGFAHKYSKGIGDIDNDMYITLGHVNRVMLEDDAVSNLVVAMREMIASFKSVVELTYDDLAIVSYSDKTLPIGSTRVFKLANSQGKSH
ncbi:hypothetical protein [Glycomyces xiaoerkulensis]|uniref:hypothetical protein n=1 Tax=Glycomyces xiaoerkulensis TaxID=2038139 RepID=UPI0012FFE336|nr:hypothetical protein [Glycomyces xiaoerkulensis]